MRRLVLSLSILGPLAVFTRPPHQVSHPKADYLGLGAAAFASWVGVPGAGEAALITAGVVAAQHRLDIGTTLTVAFVGATLGGIAGWYLGLRGGAAVFSRRGPFRRRRLQALRAGERFYERYGTIAVLFTPSWLAGINRMRARRYLVMNAFSALVWAATLGLGAFWLGPDIGELFGDLGLVGALVVGVLAVVALAGSWRRRERRRAQVP